MAGLDDSFLSELECPVCLNIPREGPLPSCPAGHILCKTCRDGVTICPTCRRPMLEDGTNTLANKMIEKVLHQCKYSQFGCNVKKPLKEIMEHEAKCPERTIKCPDLLCPEDVQIRKYHEEHAMRKCNRSYLKITDKTKVQGGRRLNVQINSGRSIESYLLEDHLWSVKPYESHGKIFYLHHYYIAREKTFAFYITMAEHFSEAEKYLAKITLKNENDERKCLKNVQDVISMDSAPRNKSEVLDAKGVMLVPWRTMSKFLKWTKKEGKEAAFIHTIIDILI